MFYAIFLGLYACTSIGITKNRPQQDSNPQPADHKIRVLTNAPSKSTMVKSMHIRYIVAFVHLKFTIIFIIKVQKILIFIEITLDLKTLTVFNT